MMLALEEILSELSGEDVNEQGLPPGFRFHPTDEELITFYLASKVFNGTFCGVEIAEVDLNRCEPWELPDVAKMGEREWYFFSLRDRKYPTGLRTNRATGAGYWKATGKDREVCSASNGALLGMKKTLVFYKGRAPRGEKTKWVMHEYRLDGDFSYRHTCKEEWVICRIFHKAGEKKMNISQSYMFEAALDMDTHTTALLECHQSQNPNHSIMETTPLQNPFVIPHHHHENDLKSLIPVVSQSQLFPINTMTNNNNHPSPSSMLFKSLLSHQDYTLKEQQGTNSSSIPKHCCKTEANFSNFQLPLDSTTTNLSWMDKIQPNPYQIQYNNPQQMLFAMDNSSFTGLSQSQGFTTTAAMTSSSGVNDMSTSLAAFNRAAGFQVMFDIDHQQPIRESWPLDA
ncbi:hypothetical protein Dsin_003924 [Dipteronia sinensis]|uniref:NAC domain-containing protein n=1 Tax=Dipteronia sinensis TaxID=43782 RepID=A0AAE0EKP8_9ROSI|nr:hypothetical protein Dsin_003924 [Dipteronia sinensis]